VNWKLVSAFVGGALIASGIVYLAVKPEPVKPTPVTKPAVASVSLPAAAPVQAPAPIATEAGRVTPAPVVRRPVPALRPRVHEKPSPMPPPVQREKLAVVARNLSAPPPLESPAPFPNLAPAPQPPTPVDPAPAAARAPTPPQVLQPENTIPTPPAPEVRTPHTVILTAGTTLAVRIGETISSARSRVGDSFLATLEHPLVIDGFIIAERGARLEGRVLETTQAGRATGSPHLTIELIKLATADRQQIRIRTVPYQKDAASSTGSDVAKVGAGTVFGAAIGAIAGGGKGAAIGAGAGAAAGGGAVLLTRGKAVDIPVEARLSFRVQEPVTITEKLD